MNRIAKYADLQGWQYAVELASDGYVFLRRMTLRDNATVDVMMLPPEVQEHIANALHVAVNFHKQQNAHKREDNEMQSEDATQCTLKPRSSSKMKKAKVVA